MSYLHPLSLTKISAGRASAWLMILILPAISWAQSAPDHTELSNALSAGAVTGVTYLNANLNITRSEAGQVTVQVAALGSGFNAQRVGFTRWDGAERLVTINSNSAAGLTLSPLALFNSCSATDADSVFAYQVDFGIAMQFNLGPAVEVSDEGDESLLDGFTCYSSENSPNVRWGQFSQSTKIVETRTLSFSDPPVIGGYQYSFEDHEAVPGSSHYSRPFPETFRYSQRGPQTDSTIVAVWGSIGSVGDDNSGSSIQGRLLGETAPAGDQFQVNDHTPRSQINPRVAADPNGGFTVVWSSESSPDSQSGNLSIQARLFDEDAMPKGPQFQVNQNTNLFQVSPDVAIADDGSIYIVWIDEDPFTQMGTVYLRTFGSDGSPGTDEVILNAASQGNPMLPRIAIDDDFLGVSWIDGNQVLLRATFAPLFKDGFEVQE